MWKGRTLAGEAQTGEIEVGRQEEALDTLRKRKILVTSLRAKSAGFTLPKFGGSGVSTKDLAIFTRQFATMITAGLPLVQCLDILAKQSSKPSFGRVIGEVTRDVEAGSTLSDALGKHRDVFDDLFRNMVAAGEAGGVLDEILMRLATYIEKADALKRKVQSAMMYPVVVLTVALGATAFMLIFIIPTFAKMFTDFGGELPLPTKIVLGMSGLAAALLVGRPAGGRRRACSCSGASARPRTAIARWTRRSLKMPVLGDVLLKGAVARFTRTLGTLIASGVPILSGLEITARTAGNKVIAEAIMTARTSIREGETVSAPLKQSGVFPPMVVQMISVGRADRRARRDAHQDRGVLRRRGGHGGGHAHLDHRAGHDRPHGRHRRRHGGRDVPADVQAHQRGRGRQRMSSAVAMPSGTARSGLADAAVDRWKGLESVLRARLVIASLALPVGILLRPEVLASAWWVLGGSLIALGMASVLFGLGVRLRRGYGVQVSLQIATDLALVTALAVFTGGRASQFVMFFALVAITGGLLARVTGGLLAAAGGWAAILVLPWLEARAGVATDAATSTLPGPALLFPFLGMVGVLAGVLGDRVQRTRNDLEQTARELDRVRLDNDAILRHLTSGVLTVDAHGRIAYINPAAEQMLGLRALVVRSRVLAEALPERLAPLRAHIEDSLARSRPRARAELQMSTAAGQPLPVGISTSLLTHHGAVTGVVAVFQDLTEVREMERRVRRNETLAELGALAAGIAHELRNGLKPISGSAEYLQRELQLKGEDAVLMELITTECGRLNRFVTDLLTYSRERDLVLETLDLDEMLAELVQVVSRDPRRAAGVTVRLVPGQSPRAIRADREQMRQVWLNLVTNALEAMPDRGTLTVRWRERGQSRVAVEFEDEGQGVTAEDLPRIGQPFFTTKEGGTGLGVAIAQRIVERHGGTLQYESVRGRGTVARVTLASAVPVVAGLAPAA